MEPARVRVANAPNRCPYCHEAAAVDRTVVCVECLARHHVECWDEARRCSACGVARRLEPATTEAPTAIDTRRPVELTGDVAAVTLVRAALPGAFSRRIAILALVAVCVAIALVVKAKDMRSDFNVRRFLFLFPALVTWGHGAGWLVTGELGRLDEALARIAGSQWVIFGVTVVLPLWAAWVSS